MSTGTHTSVQLPANVLLQLLGLVPLQQRLGGCSLVCHNWRVACIAATTSITIECSNHEEEHFDALSGWIAKYSSIQLEEVCLHNKHIPARRMLLVLHPSQLKDLQKLSLDATAVRFSDTTNKGISSGSSCLALLTALTELRLIQCCISTPEGSFAGLSSLQNLRVLELDDGDYTSSTVGSDNEPVTTRHSIHACTQLPYAISRLIQLTRLTLIMVDSNQHIEPLGPCLRRLTQLQQLQLQSCSMTESTVAQLPPSITKLDLLPFQPAVVDISSSTTPGFTCLNSLQELELCGIALDPMMLLGFSQLTSFKLFHSWLLPSAVAGSIALLATLAQLSSLRRIELDGTAAELAATQYAGLTAPSNLTALLWSTDRYHLGDRHSIPVAACQLIFSPQRQLPNLQVLLLTLHAGQYLEPGQQADVQQVCEAAGGLSAGVAGIMSACSGLRDLSLECDVRCAPEGHAVQAQLSPLAEFGLGLTRLSLTGIYVNDRVLIDVIAKLTQLQDLEVGSAVNISWAGLLQLTSLRQLHKLRMIQQCPHICCSNSEVPNILWDNRAPQGSPPDISRRLRSLCESGCNLCKGILLQQQQSEQLLGEKDQQLQAAQARIFQLEQQLLQQQTT